MNVSKQKKPTGNRIRAVTAAASACCLFCGLFCHVSYDNKAREAYADTLVSGDAILADLNNKAGVGVSMPEYVEHGYITSIDYLEDLTNKRCEANGLAVGALQKYSDVANDVQKSELCRLEISMASATSITDYNASRKEFDAIVSELDVALQDKIEQDRIEQERLEQEKLEQEAAEKQAEAQYAAQVDAQTSAQYYESNGNGLTKSGGVNYYNGRKETWYSQRVLPGGGLNIPGRHVASDGTIRDADGYIVVAASDLAYGTVVETSLGAGRVYDTGCAPGTTDVYTDW